MSYQPRVSYKDLAKFTRPYTIEQMSTNKAINSRFFKREGIWTNNFIFLTNYTEEEILSLYHGVHIYENDEHNSFERLQTTYMGECYPLSLHVTKLAGRVVLFTTEDGQPFVVDARYLLALWKRHETATFKCTNKILFAYDENNNLVGGLASLSQEVENEVLHQGNTRS